MKNRTIYDCLAELEKGPKKDCLYSGVRDVDDKFFSGSIRQYTNEEEHSSYTILKKLGFAETVENRISAEALMDKFGTTIAFVHILYGIAITRKGRDFLNNERLDAAKKLGFKDPEETLGHWRQDTDASSDDKNTFQEAERALILVGNEPKVCELQHAE